MSVQETPDAKKRDWREKGDALLAKGKYNDAIKAYDKAIKINPRLSDVWYNKGYALDILGKLENAIKAFDKAIELNPKDPDAWLNMGAALGILGKLEDAIKALDKLLRSIHKIPMYGTIKAMLSGCWVTQKKLVKPSSRLKS